MSEHCAEHESHMKGVGDIAKNLALLQKDIEYLRRDQEVILSRFGKHVDDAERQGGWHDRMKEAEAAIIQQEKDLATFRKFQLLYSALGGVVGGLIGSGAPALIPSILRHWGLA